MKGSKKVIDQLNLLLTGELTAQDLYFLHSKVYGDWGLTKLQERIGHEMTDETAHAGILIERIIFLEGKPDLTKRDAYADTSTVEEMLVLSLDYEYLVAKNLRVAMGVCEQEQDYVTREMLRVLLTDTEEDHIDWLETQLGLIKLVGTQNYLQSMI